MIKELKIGNKKLFAYPDPKDSGKHIVDVDCEVTGGVCRCSIPKDAMWEIFETPREARRNIQDILPDYSPDVREMFITGMTPAEWDAMTGTSVDYTLEKYRGLMVVDCPECEQETHTMCEVKGSDLFLCPSCYEKLGAELSS